MILTHININPELLIKLVASMLRMWAEADPWHTLLPLGKSSAFLGRVGWEVLGDQWRGMTSRKSHK